MKITKLTRWAGLLAMAITVFLAAEVSAESHAETLNINNCTQMQQYNGNDRHIDIIVNEDGSMDLEAGNKDKDFWLKDTLSWKIVTTPWLRGKNIQNKNITGLEIQFMDEYGQCRSNAPEVSPCEEKPPEGWANGTAKDMKPKPKISCKIRTAAAPLNPDHPEPGPTPTPWEYCYKITVHTEDGPVIVDPSGTGSGCGGCHADTGF